MRPARLIPSLRPIWLALALLAAAASAASATLAQTQAEAESARTGHSVPAAFQLEKSPPDAPDKSPAGRARAASRDKALAAYARILATGFAGWAETGMYANARPGRYPQAYRIGAPGGAREQLTRFPRRMAGCYFNPVPARRNFLYTEDEGGDEQFRLGLYDLRTGKSKAMGAPPGRVEGVIWDDSGAAFAYSHTPLGTDRWDVRMGHTDGRDTLLLSLPGTWNAMDLRPDGKCLLIQKYLSATVSELYVLALPGGGLTRLLPGEKPAYADNAQWIRVRGPGGHPDGTDADWEVVFTSDREGGFQRLYRMRPDSGAQAVPISQAAAWDVEWACLAKDRRSLVYALNEEGLTRLYSLDSAACAGGSAGRGGHVAAPLTGVPEGIITHAAFQPGRTRLGFTLNGPTHPAEAYSYDLASKKTERWTRGGTGGLPASAFRAPELVRYPAQDPLPQAVPGSIPAWLYLPDPGKFPGPRPVLILIHGGPEQQARPGFDPFLQFLVGRMGVAVAQPNVRGSSGYGRGYLAADDGYLRMRSVHDIGALLDWIRTRPGLDTARVAVSGRSYGGFMSLSALAEYGPRLRAGVSTVGIGHFPTFLAKTSGYRRDLRRVEYGDERDPSMAAFLDSISPLTRLPRIATPLMLCHGRNDPRVPFEESERIFAGLKAKQVPVWFLAFAEEGHGVQDRGNQLLQWRVTAEFLDRELRPPGSPP